MPPDPPPAGPGAAPPPGVDAPEGTRGRRTDLLVLAVVTAGLLVVHLWYVLGQSGPELFADEAGYLGNARWLLGGTPYTMASANFYHLGYSVLLVPAFLLGASPQATWDLVMVTNALLATSVLPLAAGLLRRGFGVPRRTAILAGLVAAAYPAVHLQAGIAWAENLLFPLFIAYAWGALRFLRPGGARGAVLLPAAAVGLYAAHPRALAVVAVTAVAVLGAAAARVVPPRVAAWAGAGLVAGTVVTWAATRAMVADRHVAGGRYSTESTSGRLLDRLASPDEYGGLLIEAAGQAWYLLAATGGLVAVGLWFLVRRGEGAGAGLRLGGDTVDRRRLAGLVVAAAVLATFVPSVLFTANPTRFDHMVYGRYNEAFVPLLLALGVAALVEAGRRPALRLLVAGAAAVVGTAGWVVLGRGDSLEGRSVRPNVWMLEPFAGAEGDAASVVGLSLAAVALTACCIGLVALRRRRAVAPLLLLAFVAVIGSAVEPVRASQAFHHEGWDLPAHVQRLEDVSGEPLREVGFHESDAPPHGLFGYQFWLDEVQFHVFDRVDEVEALPAVVIAEVGWAEGRERSARIFALDGRHGHAVWVMPGVLQDRLARSGHLVPDGWPATIPDLHQQSRIRVDAGQAEVASGAATPLSVEIEHPGGGHPWPAVDDWGLAGVVRVQAVWTVPGRAEPVAVHTTELPGTVWPGDRVEVQASLTARTADGDPLPPGTYRVSISLVQVELGAPPPPEGQAWLEVRVTG